MPDTHCKWVQANSQRIGNFRTVTTGELRHLLLNHSLTGTGLPPQESSADVFTVGLERDLNALAMLPQPFEARVSYVLGALPHEQVSELLSGLLIGAEVVNIRDYVTHQHATIPVAGTSLITRYQQASRATGCDMTAVAGDTAFQAGVRSIAHIATN